MLFAAEQNLSISCMSFEIGAGPLIGAETIANDLGKPYRQGSEFGISFEETRTSRSGIGGADKKFRILLRQIRDGTAAAARSGRIAPSSVANRGFE